MRRADGLAVRIVSCGREIDLVLAGDHVASTGDTAIGFRARVVEPDMVLCVDPHEYVASLGPHASSSAQYCSPIYPREPGRIVEADGRRLGECQTAESAFDQLLIVLRSLVVGEGVSAPGVELPSAIFIENVGETHKPLARSSTALGI